VTVENYTTKDVKALNWITTTLLLHSILKIQWHILAYGVIVKTLDSHWWYTQIECLRRKTLGQSDLVISCNFDLPVETDAIPVSKKNHKTT
jgi:hypothetical protein